MLEIRLKSVYKGPFKYYVSKKVGGWGWPNAYVCLQGGWVGLAACLRNYKNHQKRPNGLTLDYLLNEHVY